MSKIVCYYNQNLKMSPEKLSAQVAHACMRLQSEPADKVIVLKARATKFNNLIETLCLESIEHYVHRDLGLTEVSAGTATVVAYKEQV